jgi:hypothetical protein
MRILLLLLAIAATLCAQSPASNASVPGWQAIVNSMLSQNSPATNNAMSPSAAFPTGVAPMGPANLAEIKPSPGLVAALHPQTTETNLVAGAGASPASPCSVPLLNAHIPTDVNFTLRMVEPPANNVDRMQVAVPAPACPESPR